MSILHTAPAATPRVRAYLLLLLFLLCPASVLQAATPFIPVSPKHEMRAVWVTTLYGLDWPRTKAVSAESRERQKAELCQLLDRLQAVGINTVLLQTRVRGSVIYPSDIEPWDEALTGTCGQDPGYDPLRFAIDETHARGMELHAWVVTIPCFKQSVAKRMGARSVLKTHPALCRRHADMYYLDPGHPGTADYLAGICHELVSRYDIDGLHFDYIRYPEGAATFGDGATYRKYAPKGMSKAEWRRSNITAIVRRIYEDTHAVKPWVRVSSSPVGKYADLTRYSSRGWNARDAVHQDAQEWLRAGIHDILFPMMYFDGNHFYPFAADWQQQRHGRYVVPGLGVYLLHRQEKDWPLATLRRQLHFLRSQELAGQCYFRSTFLTDNDKGIYDYLRTHFYAYPALPPPCTWLDSIPPTAPAGLAASAGDGQIAELTWTASTDNLPGGVRYNVYASRRWPVDVSCAENLVATLLPQPRYSYNRLAALGLHLAVTAIDRVGNESAATQLSSHPTAPATAPRHRLQFDADGRIRGLILRPLPLPQRKQKR